MPSKPNLFVASSREAKSLAEAVQQNLEDHAYVTVWDQDAIHMSENVIDGLIRNCEESQFGVFVISPDDKATIRGDTTNIVRDRSNTDHDSSRCPFILLLMREMLSAGKAQQL